MSDAVLRLAKLTKPRFDPGAVSSFAILQLIVLESNQFLGHLPDAMSSMVVLSLASRKRGNSAIEELQRFLVLQVKVVFV